MMFLPEQINKLKISCISHNNVYYILKYKLFFVFVTTKINQSNTAYALLHFMILIH